MSSKPKKLVLVADDEETMRQGLIRRFQRRSETIDCPYEFEVDAVPSAAECIAVVRAKLPTEESYDVIVLDIHMEEELSGLNAALDLATQLGHEEPVRIMFTGYPQYRDCVQAIQGGVWDYIVKDDVAGRSAFQLVVDSALNRLQQLEQRREQEQLIAVDWYPRNFHELQMQYGGQVIALWHQPAVAVIASGCDTFELEMNLKEWREQHASWEKPYLLKVPMIELS